MDTDPFPAAASELHDSILACADALRDIVDAFPNHDNASTLEGAIRRALIADDITPKTATEEAKAMADAAHDAIKRWSKASEAILSIRRETREATTG